MIHSTVPHSVPDTNQAIVHHEGELKIVSFDLLAQMYQIEKCLFTPNTSNTKRLHLRSKVYKLNCAFQTILALLAFATVATCSPASSSSTYANAYSYQGCSVQITTLMLYYFSYPQFLKISRSPKSILKTWYNAHLYFFKSDWNPCQRIS